MPWFLPMLAAGVGAAVSTKLQNNRDKKAYNKAQAQNEQRRGDYYVNLRNDAQKGGFNPLTALRSGGGMGYSNLAGRITQPLMTRSPLAAGIAAGSTAYTNYSMSKMNMEHDSAMQNERLAHDERMTKLNASLTRATQLERMAMTMSPDGKLPPPNEWYKYLRNKDGSLKVDADGYAIFREGVKSIPLTTWYRIPGNTGTTSFLSLNMESFESGPGEIIASSTVHGGAAVGGAAYRKFIESFTLGRKVGSKTNPKRTTHEDESRQYLDWMNSLGDVLNMDANWRTKLNNLQGFN
jgi:hypothetical protein